MLVVLWILEIILGVLLILAVLIQIGKGETLGSLFGGGAQSVFGPTGPATLLEKITYGLIAAFFVVTIAITKLSTHMGEIETPRPVLPTAPSPEEVLPDIPTETEQKIPPAEHPGGQEETEKHEGKGGIKPKDE